MTCVSVVLIPVSRGLMKSELVSNSPVISLVDVGEQFLQLYLGITALSWRNDSTESQALAMPLEQVTPSLCLDSLLR